MLSECIFRVVMSALLLFSFTACKMHDSTSDPKDVLTYDESNSVRVAKNLYWSIEEGSEYYICRIGCDQRARVNVPHDQSINHWESLLRQSCSNKDTIKGLDAKRFEDKEFLEIFKGSLDATNINRLNLEIEQLDNKFDSYLANPGGVFEDPRDDLNNVTAKCKQNYASASPKKLTPTSADRTRTTDSAARSAAQEPVTKEVLVRTAPDKVWRESPHVANMEYRYIFGFYDTYVDGVKTASQQRRAIQWEYRETPPPPEKTRTRARACTGCLFGCGGGSCCFLAGTMVLTPDGERDISEIEPGDMVLSYDFIFGDVVEALVLKKLAREGQEWGTLRVSDRIDLKLTPDHPIFSANHDGVMFDAMEFKAGDSVYEINGEKDGVITSPVSSYQASGETAPVYNLTIEGHHNFFANGVLVHNR